MGSAKCCEQQRRQRLLRFLRNETDYAIGLGLTALILVIALFPWIFSSVSALRLISRAR